MTSIIVSRIFDEHITRLEAVFNRFQQHGLKLKPKKCHLFAREVEFLGHVVSGEGVRTNPKLVTDIAQKESPWALRELQAFLGLCNYYRRFVPAYSQIAHPLKELTKDGVPLPVGKGPSGGV